MIDQKIPVSLPTVSTDLHTTLTLANSPWPLPEDINRQQTVLITDLSSHERNGFTRLYSAWLILEVCRLSRRGPWRTKLVKGEDLPTKLTHIYHQQTECTEPDTELCLCAPLDKMVSDHCLIYTVIYSHVSCLSTIFVMFLLCNFALYFTSRKSCCMH